MPILSPVTDNCPSWISRRERMTIKKISWSIWTKEWCQTGESTCNIQTTSWTCIRLHYLPGSRGLLNRLVHMVPVCKDGQYNRHTNPVFNLPLWSKLSGPFNGKQGREILKSLNKGTFQTLLARNGVYKFSFSQRPVRNWNELPGSLLSSAEDAWELHG